MDTALPQKFSFILDRNLAKANCTENRVCTSCDTVVLGLYIYIPIFAFLLREYVQDIIHKVNNSITTANIDKIVVSQTLS